MNVKRRLVRVAQACQAAGIAKERADAGGERLLLLQGDHVAAHRQGLLDQGGARPHEAHEEDVAHGRRRRDTRERRPRNDAGHVDLSLQLGEGAHQICPSKGRQVPPTGLGVALRIDLKRLRVASLALPRVPQQPQRQHAGRSRLGRSGEPACHPCSRGVRSARLQVDLRPHSRRRRLHRIDGQRGLRETLRLAPVAPARGQHGELAYRFGASGQVVRSLDQAVPRRLYGAQRHLSHAEVEPGRAEPRPHGQRLPPRGHGFLPPPEAQQHLRRRMLQFRTGGRQGQGRAEVLQRLRQPPLRPRPARSQIVEQRVRLAPGERLFRQAGSGRRVAPLQGREHRFGRRAGRHGRSRGRVMQPFSSEPRVVQWTVPCGEGPVRVAPAAACG